MPALEALEPLHQFLTGERICTHIGGVDPVTEHRIR
jgi:hypothetical protein